MHDWRNFNNVSFESIMAILYDEGMTTVIHPFVLGVCFFWDALYTRNRDSERSMIIIMINNNRFLYSAFPNYDQSASQCIITPVIGFSHNSALRVHFLHSLGSIPGIPASRRFTGAHNANSTTITFASYRVPIYTPGWRAAMWIKCLAEGQKCRALTGIEPGTLWFRVKGSIQYTTAPPQGRFDYGYWNVFLLLGKVINACSQRTL